MKPELDTYELTQNKKITINLSFHYGGDSGTAIRFNVETGLWELIEWNCNEPSVYATNKDPFVLIEKEKELT